MVWFLFWFPAWHISIVQFFRLLAYFILSRPGSDFLYILTVQGFHLWCFSGLPFFDFEICDLLKINFFLMGVGIFSCSPCWGIGGKCLLLRRRNSGNAKCHLIIHCLDAVRNLWLLRNLLGVLGISRTLNFGSKRLVYSGHISFYHCEDWHGSWSTRTGGRNLFGSATIASTIQGERSSLRFSKFHL